MAEIVLVRQDGGQLSEVDKEAARRALLKFVDGHGQVHQARWRRFLGMLWRMEPGEMATIRANKPRSGPFHRRHFAIEQALFETQERFEVLDQFLYWLKVGAGWVTWAAGPKGGVVPIPRSISYAKTDELEFREFHAQVMQFLRGPHAAKYLWPHLKDKADEMMDTILSEFNE